MRSHKRWLSCGLALGFALILAAPALAADNTAPTPAPAVSEDKLFGLLDRGEFYAASGKFDQAQQHWKQALDLQPGWAPAQKRLADLPARRKDYPYFLAEMAAAEERRRARLNLLEGVDHFNARRFGQAGEKFSQYRQVFPDDPTGKQYQALAAKFAGQR